MLALSGNSRESDGYPDGVACKQIVVFRGAQMAYKTELDNKIVYKLLSFAFAEFAFPEISFDIYINEFGYSSD